MYEELGYWGMGVVFATIYFIFGLIVDPKVKRTLARKDDPRLLGVFIEYYLAPLIFWWLYIFYMIYKIAIIIIYKFIFE